MVPGDVVPGEEITGQEEQALPTEEINQLQESVNLLMEQQSQVSSIDEFISNNGELITDTIALINWYGFIGVPLLITVTLFWVVYKQFLYTRI